MGCDIHAYIEHRKGGESRWSGFGGRINPGRNYSIFGFLAGVRQDGPPVAEKRGFPNDAAYESREDNLLFITKDGDGDDCCTLEQAVRWSGNPNLKVGDFVQHPDWHSHSWVTASELEKAVKAATEAHGYEEPEYWAIIAAMRSFESRGLESRLVFWFDN